MFSIIDSKNALARFFEFVLARIHNFVNHLDTVICKCVAEIILLTNQDTIAEQLRYQKDIPSRIKKMNGVTVSAIMCGEVFFVAVLRKY